MKISIKNLGILKQAEFTLGDLTIICGENNTGKTYATYALFGFLSSWREDFLIDVPDRDVQRLLSEGSVALNIQDYIANAQSILEKGCAKFSNQISHVFAASANNFAESRFAVTVKLDDIQPLSTYEFTTGAAATHLLSIAKKAGSPLVTVSLLVEKENVKISKDTIRYFIENSLKSIVFERLFPKPFIVSAERTGAAIFRTELNFARNRLLEKMNSKEKDIDPLELFPRRPFDYALPVQKNIDFTLLLESLAKRDSFIAKDHSDILGDFADIIDGEYRVTNNDELYYIPRGKRVKLTMGESSSAVRSLLDIGFYLRHVAAPGDLLMVDEPELNLHPENQRRVARLFARLINIGLKVFITTHSDYIIKELNTLIMLNQEDQRLKALAEREGYQTSELLDPGKVKVYIAEEASMKLDGAKRNTKCPTLVQADIDPKYGINARSFDKTIDDMNRIQEEIVWGGTE